MKVLVACEESQRVCSAFRNRGYEAYSCDICEPSGGHPEWHILGDALDVLNPQYHAYNGRTEIFFHTMDGAMHSVPKWDLIIAHPPCTYLSNAGACRLFPHKGEIDKERYELGMKAKEFFMKFMCAECDYICVENPVPTRVFELPKYAQIIQPYEYGEPYSKKTCLWLKGLPKLQPTNVLSDYKPYVSCHTSLNKGNPDKQGFSRAGGGSTYEKQNFHRYRRGNSKSVWQICVR